MKWVRGKCQRPRPIANWALYIALISKAGGLAVLRCIASVLGADQDTANSKGYMYRVGMQDVAHEMD